MMSNSRTILYLTTSFAPCGGTGTLRLVKQMKHLSQRGWNPVVATTFGLHSSYPDESLLEEAQQYAEIHRADGSSSLWNTARFFYKTVGELKKRFDFDWVVTTSPRDWDHVIGWWVSRLFDIRWQCDLRDPPGLSGYRRIKTWFINQAELITTAWPPEELLPTSLENHGNAHWIPNGYDPEDFGTSGDNSSKTRLLYAGSVYREAHDPFPFLQSLAELKDTGQIDDDTCEVLLVGNISNQDLKEEITAFLADHNLTNMVETRSFSDHSSVAELVSNCDLGLVMCFNRAIPYKFVEYLGANKPVIGQVCGDSVLKKLVADEESVRLFDREEQASYQSLLANWMDSPPDSSYSDEIEDQFHLESITDRLETLYLS